MKPPRDPNIVWLAAIVALGAFASLAVASSGHERSPAVYPPQRLPLRFDHALHLNAGAECVTCHDKARKSEAAADNNLPGHASKDPHAECTDCHDIDAAQKGKAKTDDPPSSCGTCHAGFDETAQRAPPAVEFPTANLRFTHKAHVDRKIACSTCHGEMTDVTLATTMQLPKMATCLTCHDGKAASAECTTCHLKKPSGRLQLAFDSAPLRPMQGNPLGLDHGPRYEFTHGARAKVARSECLACHAESECQQCHDSLQKPLSVHPNDFITLHPLQARVNATECQSCHRYQSFCAACHERSGVGMSADPMFRPTNMRVHPDYATWVDRVGPEHHSVAAARNLTQCIACHREESCMQCHAAGTIKGAPRQVNPHPTDFATRCKAMFQKNSTGCLKCHNAGIAEQCL